MENQKQLGIVAAILVVGFLGLVYWLISGAQPKVTLPPAPPFVWGTYSGEAGGIPAFEALVGKPVDIAATFTGFSEEFPSEFAADLATTTQTLLVFWEPEEAHASILSGKFDQKIRAFAEAARAYAGPIILVPFNEPNLYEPDDAPTPWGFGADGNTAESFKAAWQHVRQVFGEAPNVKWGLAFNNVAIPEDPKNTITNLYPGEEWVDYVGVDGFNGYDGWQTPGEIFDATLGELKSLNKPIFIFSTASMEGAQKQAWIRSFFSYLKEKPEIKGFVWFHINKEFDWRVNSDPDSLAAFKEGLNF